MSHTHILLAEDDMNLGNLLQEYLELKGYQVSLARHGLEALDLFHHRTFELLILDVMMPKKDGFSVARDVRKINHKIPIIFLTAKAQKEDKIEGFESGGDDYISKPFSMEELLLRIKAVLRRTNPMPTTEEVVQFEIGNFFFDYTLQLLTHGGKEIKLSTKESGLLKMLCLHRNDILKREDALIKIWGEDGYFTARSMDVYITKLRKYLNADPNIQIMNVHGKGYKLLILES